MPPAEMKTIDMRKTGGEVDVVVFSLINHANDPSDQVTATILRSLMDLSSHEPEMVTTAIASFISKRSDKIDQSHRNQLLNILVRVLEDVCDKLSTSVAQDLTDFCVNEMTVSVDVKSDWQGPASQCLVLLAGNQPDYVIQSLLNVFKPGVEPHYYVIKTFADVAAAHSTEFLPHIREVLSRVIPVLGLIRKPAMKWAFTTALGRFAEAIPFFFENATPEQKAKVSTSDYEADFTSAWDVVFSKWLGDPEPKVRFAVIESLGYMANVLKASDFDIRFQKIIPSYLQSYKKEARADHLSITQGMCAVLDKAMNCDNIYNNPLLLTSIYNGLHELMSLPTQDPMSNPNALRNTNEILRCWEILGRYMPDQTISYIVGRFQLKTTGARVGSLVILRHFVNSLDSILKDRKPIIMSSVTTLITENDSTLKLTLLHLIASMANMEYLALDGGETLVKYVAAQAALKAPTQPTKDASGKEVPVNRDAVQIKKTADHMLGVLALRVPSAIPIMWPFLLEFLPDLHYTNACSSLYRAIHDICKTKKEANDMSYIIEFRKHVNLPSVYSIFARTFVLLSQPFKQPNLGINIASASIYLSESLHPSLSTYWIDTMPMLVEHLTNSTNSDDFPLSKWQDTLLKVFKESISIISDEIWLGELAQEFGRNIQTYKDHESLRLLYRFLGATLSKIQNRMLIQNLTEIMINTVVHTNEEQQRGLAQGLGMIGNPHLDVILPKVTELLTKTPEHRKSSGFFGFGAKKDLGPEDEVKATCVLAYGYITAYANPELILSRLDVHILHNIIPLLGLPNSEGKSTAQAIAPILKVQIAKALDLVGKTVNVARLPANQRHFILKRRDDLVKGLLMMIDEREGKGSPAMEKPSKELRLLCLGTLSTLSLLEPKYEKAMLERMLDITIPMFSLFTGGAGASNADGNAKDGKDNKDSKKDAGNAPAKKGSVATAVDNADGEALLHQITTLYQSFIHVDPSVDLILLIISKLEKLLTHKHVLVRQRVVQTYLVILKKFVPKITQEHVPQKETCFPEMGKHISYLVTRMNDTNDITRGLAVECIQAILYIDQLLENPSEPKGKQELKFLTELKNNLSAPAPTQVQGLPPLTSTEVCLRRYHCLDDIISVITNISTVGETIALVRALIPRFTDNDVHSAMGAARAFTKLISIRGSEIKVELPDIIKSLFEASKKITNNDVKRACGTTYRILTKLHFNDIMDIIIKQAKTPLPRQVVEYLMAVTDHVEGIISASGQIDKDTTHIRLPDTMSSKELVEKVIIHMLSIINDTPIDVKTPTPTVMSATCMLTTVLQLAVGDPIMVKNEEEKDEPVEPLYQNSVHQANVQDNIRMLCLTHFSPIIATCMMRCGTAYGVDDGVSSRQAIRCLKSAFKACEQDTILGVLNGQKDIQVMNENDSIGLLLSKEIGNVWNTLNSETYDDSITIITRQICTYKPDCMSSLLDFVTNFYSQQAYKGQRIVATAILAEFVTHSLNTAGENNTKMQNELIKFMLPRVADKLAKVRKQALRGMGNLVMVWNGDVAQHATAVITSLSGASEDTDAEVATEAVNALTRIAQVVDGALIGPMLVSICFRMRPAFDRKQKKVRKAAFALFSELCRFGKRIEQDDSSTNDNFLDQLHTNLPIYVCHLRDPDTGIVEFALKGLKNISNLLNDDIYNYISSIDEVDEDNYDQVINEYCRLLAVDFGDKLRTYLDGFVSYYTSNWMSLRSAAVYAVGSIIKHSKTSKLADARKKLNLHALTASLVKMLTQEDESVRQKTSKALALLYDI